VYVRAYVRACSRGPHRVVTVSWPALRPAGLSSRSLLQFVRGGLLLTAIRRRARRRIPHIADRVWILGNPTAAKTRRARIESAVGKSSLDASRVGSVSDHPLLSSSRRFGRYESIWRDRHFSFHFADDSHYWERELDAQIEMRCDS